MISSKGEFTVWVSKVENKGTYGVITASTSRKDRQKENWLYSNWYIRLAGESFKNISKLFEVYVDGEMNGQGFLVKKFPIVITSFSITNEAYEKDGVKVYNNFQMVAWDFKMGEQRTKGESTSKKPSPFDE